MNTPIPFIDGIKQFKEHYFKEHKSLFKELSEKGQSPRALFIGCSDSRVIPNLITSAKPGDLFIVRNIGNMVPPFKPDEDFHGTAAAIEYAVSVLNVEDIIVCGHSQCGACRALYENIEGDELIHVKKWLELGKEAKEKALSTKVSSDEELFNLTEKLNVISQLKNLLTYPGVKRRVEDGTLRLHGWHYNISTGDIYVFNPEKNQFEKID